MLIDWSTHLAQLEILLRRNEMHVGLVLFYVRADDEPPRAKHDQSLRVFDLFGQGPGLVHRQLGACRWRVVRSNAVPLDQERPSPSVRGAAPLAEGHCVTFGRHPGDTTGRL